MYTGDTGIDSKRYRRAGENNKFVNSKAQLLSSTIDTTVSRSTSIENIQVHKMMMKSMEDGFQHKQYQTDHKN